MTNEPGVSARFWGHLRRDEVKQAVALLDACPDDAESLYERAELYATGELGFRHEPELFDKHMREAAQKGHVMAMAYVGMWSNDEDMQRRVAQSQDSYALALLERNWSVDAVAARVQPLLWRAAMERQNPYAIRDYLLWYWELLTDREYEMALRLCAETGSSNGLYNYGAWLWKADRKHEALPFWLRAADRFNELASRQLCEVFFNWTAFADWRRGAHILVSMRISTRRDEILARRLSWDRQSCRLHWDERICEMYIYGRARCRWSLLFSSHANGNRLAIAKDIYVDCTARACAATVALIGVLHRRKTCPRDVARVIGRLVWDGTEEAAPQWITPKLAEELF